MLLFLRSLKQLKFMNREFRKYLGYAIGEMALVVIGILIALQIDNWNSERQQRALLDSYLHTIAANIRDDAGELELLTGKRSKRSQAAFRAQNFLTGGRKQSFSVDEVYFFRNIIYEAREDLYFNADSSGFESIKNSGVIDRLQGQDSGRLLSKYYDQVKIIEKLEARQNAAVDALSIQYSMSIPHDVEIWAFDDPEALAAGRFAELQPVYAEVINGAAARELLAHEVSGIDVMREYDHLRQLGEACIRSIEGGSRAGAGSDIEALLAGDSSTAGAHAELVVGGQLVAQHYYVTGVADRSANVFDFRSIEPRDDGLHFAYPGSDSWAAIYLGYFGLAVGRPSQDFSHFDTLVLELKGDRGAERVTVHVKDRDLPDWEAPDTVTLQITDQWEAYEIDLASFPRTNFGILMSPLGFTFLGEEPLSFSLRNARYVSSGRNGR
jgi:hypothetical protein